jgi:hypothetical protein
MSGEVTKLTSVPNECGFGNTQTYFRVTGSNNLEIMFILVMLLCTLLYYYYYFELLSYLMIPSEQAQIT